MKAKHHLLFFLTIFIGFILLLFATELFIPDSIKNAIFKFPQIDTIGHFTGFFILTWLVSTLLRLPLLNIVLCLIFYGALSEIGQWYLGFRNGEFTDFYADTTGILVFALLKWISIVYGKKQNEHHNLI